MKNLRIIFKRFLNFCLHTPDWGVMACLYSAAGWELGDALGWILAVQTFKRLIKTWIKTGCQFTARSGQNQFEGLEYEELFWIEAAAVHSYEIVRRKLWSKVLPGTLPLRPRIPRSAWPELTPPSKACFISVTTPLTVYILYHVTSTTTHDTKTTLNQSNCE